VVTAPCGELEVMVRLTSIARRATARAAWRAACQRRTTHFSSILRKTARLVPGEPATRTKVPGAWQIEVERPSSPLLVMSIITKGCRTVADFCQPIPVHVHEPALVDMVLLEELEARSMVQIVVAP
jgi:hypothetical protein